MPDPHSVFSEDERAEIKQIVHEALNEFFRDYGKNAKTILLTVAAIVGAITVILGGMKSILAWLGFAYLK